MMCFLSCQVVPCEGFIDNLRDLVETPTYHLYYIFTYKLFMFVNHFLGYHNLFETCFSQNAIQSCCIQELFVIPSQAINDVFFYNAAKARCLVQYFAACWLDDSRGEDSQNTWCFFGLVKVHETSSKQQKHPYLWEPLGDIYCWKSPTGWNHLEMIDMIQNDQFHWSKLKNTLEHDIKFTQQQWPKETHNWLFRYIGKDIRPKSFGVYKIALFSGSHHWPTRISWFLSGIGCLRLIWWSDMIGVYIFII